MRQAIERVKEMDLHEKIVDKALPAVGKRLYTLAGVIQSVETSTQKQLRSLKVETKTLRLLVEDSLGNQLSLTFIPS